MNGRRSPWGDGENGGAGPGAEDEAAATPAGDGGDPGQPGGEPAPGEGPRNPWATPEGARRSAGLEDIFRHRPSGPGGGGPRFPFQMPRRANGGSWGPALGAGMVALFLLITASHQLGSTEQGIVTTFGKYTRTIGPGFNLTLPWPLQDVDVTDVTSIRRDSIPEGDQEKLMLTSDQNLVDLSYIVRWSVKDLKLFSFQLDDPKATVREVAEAAMRASVAEVPLNDVMGGSGRAEIEQSVRQRMQAILDAYRSGVVIQGVDIKKADPPEKVVAAFQQVTVAQQDAQKDQSNAQAYAQQLVAIAQGEAAQFDKVYAQYKLAPEVTRRRMYYETMERVLSANDKVIVGNSTTSYLPLPEIRRKAQADDGQQAQSQQAQNQQGGQ